MHEQFAKAIIVSLLPHTVDPKLMALLDTMSMESIIAHSKAALASIIQDDDTLTDGEIQGAGFATKLLVIASGIVYKAQMNSQKPAANPTFKREDGTEETMEEMLTRLSKEN